MSEARRTPSPVRRPRAGLGSWRTAAALGALLGATVVTPRGTAAQDGVGFRARVAEDTVYVGQQATYELTVRIPAAVRQRLRRNPQFVAPEARAMLAYDLPMPKAAPPGEGDEVYVFRRALFPLTPGRYALGAATLSYALPQSPSFFSREDERNLRSELASFVAVEPPTVGRPDSWGGAVGRWRVRARVDGAGARVGDPFVLTLRVEGVGNATLLPRPAIEIPWAIVVPEDERVVLDSTPTALAGAKEFAWLVTPKESGTRQVPSLAYVFFDPEARRYETARTDPISLRVGAGDLVTIPPRAPGAERAATLSIRPALSGAAPAAGVPMPVLWAWLALLAPLPWAWIRWRARRPRARPEPTPAERLAAAGDGAPPGAVRSLFGDALRRRTGVLLERATGPGALAAALRREGVTPETAAEAERLRDALDTAAYARAPGGGGLRDRARTLLRRIEEEARRRGAGLALLALLPLLGCAGAGGREDQRALAAFAEGQTAFAGQDYARARDAFLRAANAEPRDANAWANLGTAAWQAGDTAAAVLGWQRALRLDPLDRELRPRLARVRAPQSRGAARVWPLPVRPLAAAALLLWGAGWAWSALRRARRRSARRAALLIAPGLACGALAAAGEWQARAADLAVIATPTPLRALPALGSEPGAVPLVGEVVRIRERRGVWLRIELEAGRAGWYPAERTYPLARD